MPVCGPRHIRILRAGNTDTEVIRRFGDYDRWFTDRMVGMGCRFSIHHVPDRGVPETGDADGILVTGTAASVLDRAPWMGPLGQLLAAAAGRADGPPVLAVCFGAQLAAQALGGGVARNPRGWEIGTVRIGLTEAGRTDLLFAGLATDLEVQATHEDIITELPPAVTLLAANDHAPVQAFHAGRLHAVQFHPEASPEIIRLLVRLRRPLLEADARRNGAPDAEAARRTVDRIEDSVHETGNGPRILENWVRRCVGASTAAPDAYR